MEGSLFGLGVMMWVMTTRDWDLYILCTTDGCFRVSFYFVCRVVSITAYTHHEYTPGCSFPDITSYLTKQVAILY
jgi:hypothetical protein